MNKRQIHALYFSLQIQFIWLNSTLCNQNKQWKRNICFTIAVVVKKYSEKNTTHLEMEMQLNWGSGGHVCYQTSIVKYRTGDDVRCHLKIIVPGGKE